MTQLEQNKKLFRQTRQRVRALLNWTEEEYGYFQLEMGLAYMRDVLNMDDWAIRYMEQSKRFWIWWVNHWNLFDMHDVLPALEEAYSDIKSLQNAYEIVHQPTFISKHPAMQIMNDTYAQMIAEVNKEITTQTT